MKGVLRLAVLTAVSMAAGAACAAQGGAPADPRLREVVYDPRAVVAIPVKRGVITLIELAADETISEIASGLGSDCARADGVWCIASQAGGRHVFVKPKTGAAAANTLAVVTNRRTHSFRFDVLADRDAALPVYRLVVRQSEPMARATAAPLAQAATSTPLPVPMSSPTTERGLVAERLQSAPQVLNTQYSLAEGKDSQDIVPTLVFDDGRFTYLRLPGNREIPAVFHVLGNGSETLVNTRMEGDLLVVDRVSRQLMVRAGSAVVGLWNEAFDIEGQPPTAGTTAPGVRRAMRAVAEAPAAVTQQGNKP